MLEIARRVVEAEPALRKAADVAARKGSVVEARQANDRLAALETA